MSELQISSRRHFFPYSWMIEDQKVRIAHLKRVLPPRLFPCFLIRSSGKRHIVNQMWYKIASVNASHDYIKLSFCKRSFKVLPICFRSGLRNICTGSEMQELKRISSIMPVMICNSSSLFSPHSCSVISLSTMVFTSKSTLFVILFFGKFVKVCVTPSS